MIRSRASLGERRSQAGRQGRSGRGRQPRGQREHLLQSSPWRVVIFFWGGGGWSLRWFGIGFIIVRDISQDKFAAAVDLYRLI